LSSSDTRAVDSYDVRAGRNPFLPAADAARAILE
jgi:hypothetical protein